MVFAGVQEILSVCHRYSDFLRGRVIFADVLFMITRSPIEVPYSFIANSPEYEMACLFIGWICMLAEPSE